MSVPREGSKIWVNLSIMGTHTSYNEKVLDWYRHNGVSRAKPYTFWNNESVVLVDRRTGRQIKILNGNHRLKVARDTGKRFKAEVKLTK